MLCVLPLTVTYLLTISYSLMFIKINAYEVKRFSIFRSTFCCKLHLRRSTILYFILKYGFQIICLHADSVGAEYCMYNMPRMSQKNLQT